jgi:hypothetical protein
MRSISAVLIATAMTAGTLVATSSAALADRGPYGAVVAQNTSGDWEEFWIASNCQVYHAWGATNYEGPFPYSASLGGCVVSSDGLDVGENADGRLEVFVVGTNGAIWHNWQEVASVGPWSGWYQLGSIQVSSGPKVYSEISGYTNMVVYTTGMNGTPYYIEQESPGCCWSGWTPY